MEESSKIRGIHLSHKEATRERLFRKSEARKRDCYHKVFLLRQILLPELVPDVLDFAQIWASDTVDLYIDPKDGFLDVQAAAFEFGQTILTFGPLTRIQARGLRAVNFTVACTHDRTVKWAAPTLSSGTLWFEAHSQHDIPAIKGTNDGRLAIGHLDHDIPRDEYHLFDNMSGTRWMELYCTEDESRTGTAACQRLLDLHEGDVINLSAHATIDVWTENQWINRIRMAQIEVSYRGLR